MAALNISVWGSSSISQTRFLDLLAPCSSSLTSVSNQPGSINIITVSLMTAIPIRIGSFVTLIGLAGSFTVSLAVVD